MSTCAFCSATGSSSPVSMSVLSCRNLPCAPDCAQPHRIDAGGSISWTAPVKATDLSCTTVNGTHGSLQFPEQYVISQSNTVASFIL